MQPGLLQSAQYSGRNANNLCQPEDRLICVKMLPCKMTYSVCRLSESILVRGSAVNLQFNADTTMRSYYVAVKLPVYWLTHSRVACSLLR
jgi:hypothetical protein